MVPSKRRKSTRLTKKSGTLSTASSDRSPFVKKKKSSKGSTSCTNCVTMLANGKIAKYSIKLLGHMRHLQHITKTLIPKMPFASLIRELLQTMQNQPEISRMQPAALSGLQTAAEYYITTLFEDSNKCAMHAKRATVMPPDVKLVLDLRSTYETNIKI